MDFLNSLSSNKLPKAPVTSTGAKLTGRKGPMVKGRHSSAKPNLQAVRANADRRGHSAVLESLEAAYGSDQAAAYLAQALTLNPGAVDAVRKRTQHPVNFTSPSVPSAASSQSFQDRYYANQRRDRTVSNMARYSGSAPLMSDLFKMGGGSFNPIQRPRPQQQTNPFYTNHENATTNTRAIQGSSFPMGGGSKVDPFEEAEKLSKVWHSNPNNTFRPDRDFLPEA